MLILMGIEGGFSFIIIFRLYFISGIIYRVKFSGRKYRLRSSFVYSWTSTMSKMKKTKK